MINRTYDLTTPIVYCMNACDPSLNEPQKVLFIQGSYYEWALPLLGIQ